MRRRLRRTRLRLTLAYTLSFGVVLAAVGAGLWLTVTTISLQSIDATLRLQLRPVTDAIAHRHDPVPGVENFDRSSNLPEIAADGSAVDAVFVTGNAVIARSPGGGQDGEVMAMVSGFSPASSLTEATTPDGRTRVLLAAYADTGGIRGSVVLSTSLATYNTGSVRLAVGLAVAALALVGAAGGLGYRLAGAALRPVRRIAATARDLSEHDLHRRVDLNLPDDELGELEATFNQMLGRLEVAFEALRRFSADAAHELRTPLALMRAEIEVTLARSREDAEYRHSLETVAAEVGHLTRLVDRLLIVARAEAGMLRPSLEPVDLGDLVPETLERWRAPAAERGITIGENLADRAGVEADPAMIRQLLDNLMENAVRHSPDRGVIEVTVSLTALNWTLCVDDAGAGVAPELRRRIFERFLRADSSRSRTAGGAGLGLALCDAIVRAHGGTIVVETAPSSGGARFQIVFPRRPA